MEMKMEIQGFGEVLSLLRDLPPAVVSKAGGPVKAALRKGALVILAQVRENLRIVTSNATSNGINESTGFLLKNVFASRGKAPIGGNGERYLVRVRKRDYPKKEGQRNVNTLQTAHYLEYGTSRQPMEPFIRPAFEAKAEEAIKTAERELIIALVKVVKDLGKQRVKVKAG